MIIAQAGAFVFFALVIPIEVVFAKRDARRRTRVWSAAGELGPQWSWAVRRSPFYDAFLSGSLPYRSWPLVLAHSITGFAPTLLVACIALFFGGNRERDRLCRLCGATADAGRVSGRVVALVDSIAKAGPGFGS